MIKHWGSPCRRGWPVIITVSRGQPLDFQESCSGHLRSGFEHREGASIKAIPLDDNAKPSGLNANEVDDIYGDGPEELDLKHFAA